MLFQLYRMEDYAGALKLYREVIKNSTDDYDAERQTNISAVMASLAATGEHVVCTCKYIHLT